MENIRRKFSFSKYPFPAGPKRNKRPNIFIYLLVFLIIWGLFQLFATSIFNSQLDPISKVITQVKEGKVNKVEVRGDLLEVTLKDGGKILARKEPNQSFLEILSNEGIDVEKIPEGVTVHEQFPWGDVIFNIVIPVLVMVAFFFLVFRQAKGTAADIFSFGKSKARLFMRGPKDKDRVTFKDVAGAVEVKRELTEIVDFLRNPDKYRKLGARIPKGVLLIGPSGVGKTLIARAVAGEAGVPFFSAAGSEFMEMLVGVGASRVRDMFRIAKAAQPSVIFIDEIDAIGRQRSIGLGGAHDEREQTLNQILVEMDGFDPRTNVIILAATNRPDLLDPALVRPGRFDRRITLELPDINEREEIFKIHIKGKPLSKDINLRNLAEQTVGFSGADIENMINEAAIFAARKGRSEIMQKDFSDAATKVKLGPERRRLQSDLEKKVTAYHEAGHALVAHVLPNTDPVQRISIISRSMALGFTDIVPRRDRYNETKTRLLEFITTALAGRAAERLIFNEETIGASNDIEKATQIARKMVTEYGMSRLGPIHFTSSPEKLWLASQLGEKVSYSDEMAEKIDREVSRIINSCYKRATEIIKKNRDVLDKLSEELIKKETLERKDFEEIVGKDHLKSTS